MTKKPRSISSHLKAGKSFPAALKAVKTAKRIASKKKK